MPSGPELLWGIRGYFRITLNFNFVQKNVQIQPLTEIMFSFDPWFDPFVVEARQLVSFGIRRMLATQAGKYQQKCILESPPSIPH